MRKQLLFCITVALGLFMGAQDVHFTFDNAEITNDGVNDFYEVDVLIQTINATGSFKLGSGQLYFNYNTVALGENVAANNKIEITQPNAGGYIAGQFVDAAAADIYGSFTVNDNTTSRVSWSFSQVFSSSTFAADNVDDTPRLLCHIKIEFADSGIDPMFMFEDGSSFDDQFFTACGPAGGGPFTTADCTNDPGTQLVNDSFDSGMATLGLGGEQLEGLEIYPNPVEEVLNVKTNLSSDYMIIDLTGKIVHRGRFETGDNQLNLKDYQSGVYVLRLDSPNGQVIRKIIKE